LLDAKSNIQAIRLRLDQTMTNQIPLSDKIIRLPFLSIIRKLKNGYLRCRPMKTDVRYN